jgi:hypothetical protein
MGKYPLGGSKVSTSSSGGGSLTTNSVETSHIQDRAVTADKIQDEAVTSAKLGPDITGLVSIEADAVTVTNSGTLVGTGATILQGTLAVAGNTTLKGSVTFDFDSNVTGSGNNNDTPIVVFEGDESTEQPPGYLGSLFTMRPAVNNATQLLLGSATYHYRHIRSYAATFVDTSINDSLKTRVSSAGLIVHGSNTLEVGGDTALNSDLAVAGNTTLKGTLTLDGNSDITTPNRPAVRFEFTEESWDGTSNQSQGAQNNKTVTRLIPTASNNTDHAETNFQIGSGTHRFFTATHHAKIFSFQFTPSAGRFEIKRYGSNMNASFYIDSAGLVRLPNLPVQADGTGLTTGTLYNSSGFLKVA